MKTFYYIATTIITIVFVLFIWVVSRHLCSVQSSINKVEISLTMANDSVASDSILTANKDQIEKLVALINEQETELNRQYEFTMKARADEADLTKILSCVGAFVLAILAFFGINSYKELQEKLIEKAESKAKDTATTKINKIVKTEVNRVINEKIDNKNFATTLKTEITDGIISGRLVTLEEEINRLKEKLSTTSTNTEEDDSPAPNAEEDEVDFEPMGEVPDLSNLNND